MKKLVALIMVFTLMTSSVVTFADKKIKNEDRPLNGIILMIDPPSYE